MHLFQQAGRTRRSHPEDVGHVTTKGSVGRTTPAVAASERRKSLKLVSGRYTKRRGKRICLVAHWSSSLLGLSSRVCPLRPVSVSSPQLLWTGCPQDPRQTVEQQLHRGKKHILNAAECQQAPIFLKRLHKSDIDKDKEMVKDGEAIAVISRRVLFHRYE